MSMKTSVAIDKFVENKKDERDNRKRELIKFIKKRPGETAYSISRDCEIPLASVQNLLDELEKEYEIKFEKTEEKGRIKKKVFPMTIYDMTYDYFLFFSFINPKVRDRNIKLAKLSQEKGIDIQVEMDNGEIKTIKSEESIEEFIDNYS